MSGPDFHGCYNPDHSPVYNYTACNSQATHSWCCYKDDVCLDNGYCLQTAAPWSNRLGRGGCTDNTWSSDACPQYCADTSTNGPTGIYLAYDTPGGDFCCRFGYDTSSDQCQNSTRGSYKPFPLPRGSVIFNRTNGATFDGFLSLDALNLTSQNATTPISSTSSSLPASASSSSSAASVSSNSNVVPVAVGIAVPLGVLLLAALAACFVLFNQNRKLRKEAQEAAARPPPPEKNVPHNTPATVQSQPVPMYEYSTPMHKTPTSTNWAPYTPQSQTTQQTMVQYGNEMQPQPNVQPYYGPQAAVAGDHPAHTYFGPPSANEPQARAHELATNPVTELAADDPAKAHGTA